MLIIPAIHIKDGHCVSVSADVITSNSQVLEAQAYSNDPEDVVGRWFDKGAKRVHLVDLDGALEGRAVNADLICQIAFRFPNLPIQVSGGIQTLADIEKYIKAGVDFVVLGSKAIEDPEFVLKVSQVYSGKIMVSVEVSNGDVLSEAGTKAQALNIINFAKTFDQPSIAGIIYSELEEGVQGINIDSVAQLATLLTVPVLAFGGIEGMDDVRALYAESHKGIAAAISASALRGGDLDLVEAQAYCDEFED